MLMVSGIGQFHTNEVDPLKPTKKLKPYLTIDWLGIQALVDNPQKAPKDQAQWLIPSSYPSRNFAKQELLGEYHLMWADLDNNTLPIKALADIIADSFQTDFEIYTSRSATKELVKCRILIPLLEPLCSADWILSQKIFNDKLRGLSIEPDPAAERSAQLCYLPNRGEYYANESWREGVFFNPPDVWAEEIQSEHEKLKKDRLELEKLSAQRLANVRTGKGLIEAFNDTYTPLDILINAGYSQRGNTFCHPKSESGNYSANVRMADDGVLRVHTLSTSDKLWVEGSKSGHDAFSCFTVLVHNGDINKALKDAGDVPFNKLSQIEYAKNQELPNTGKPFTLKSFSITGESNQMETSLYDEHFVLNGIALRGQMTVLYAKPNTGKTLITLWLLIQSIKEKSLDAKHIFYVNADDDFRGLITKTKLAEQYGFEMLSPSYKGFTAAHMQAYMKGLIESETASETVIILDTLKKFVSLMDKKEGSTFMARAGEFIASGGTIIALAHTNKNRDAEGKVVFSGTSDISDDASCCYTIDEVSKDTTMKKILFENFKCRGGNATTLAFNYSIKEGATYIERLESISTEDAYSSSLAKELMTLNIQKGKDDLSIIAINECLAEGINLKTELINSASKRSGISKPKINTILDRYKGIGVNSSDLWMEKVGDKNAKAFYLLMPEVSSLSVF